MELANACKYGLGAGIWTQNLAKAHQAAAAIEAGVVWVNTHHRNDPSSPWCVTDLLVVCREREKLTDLSWRRSRGGMKDSGIGRENGIEALEACAFHGTPFLIGA